MSLRQLASHASKYSIVGLGSTATDFAVYAVLTKGFGIHPLYANLVSRPAGGLFCFVMNKVWTFKATGEGETRAQFIRFWTQWAAGLLLSEGFIFVLHNLARVEALVAKFIAETILAVANFLIMRHWTFRKP